MKTLLLSLLVLGACSSKKPEKKPIIYPSNSPEVTTTNPKETSIIAKQTAAEQGTNVVAEVKFPKNGSALSTASQAKIKEQYQEAKKKGKIDEVQLVTWADKEFPTKDQKSLGKAQTDLVEKRNDVMTTFLAELDDDLDVKAISMAERADTLARFTATEEAQVKASLDKKVAPGRAGEAMVIFVLK